MYKISFIVIGYNIEQYIERCMNSIVNQTMKNIEILFVDDGSTDDTVNKVKAINDSRIRIISQQNKGANSARKTGLINSIGEYIIFIDGDDWISVDAAKELYLSAIDYKCDILYYNYFLTYDDHKEVKFNHCYSNLNGFRYLELILQQKISHNLWNKMYKREYLNRNGFLDIPDITMGDDLVASIKLAVNRPKVHMTNKYYYYYYQRTGSVTKEISPKILEIKKALESIEHILQEKKLLDTYKKHMEYLWFLHGYYFLVVSSRHKTSYIQRDLYIKWKSKNINIKDNEYCNEYISKIGAAKKISLALYNFNYNTGYFFSRVFILLRNKFRL